MRSFSLAYRLASSLLNSCLFFPFPLSILLYSFCLTARSLEPGEMAVLLTAQFASFATLLPLEEYFARRLQRAIESNIRSMNKQLFSKKA